MCSVVTPCDIPQTRIIFDTANSFSKLSISARDRLLALQDVTFSFERRAISLQTLSRSISSRISYTCTRSPHIRVREIQAKAEARVDTAAALDRFQCSIPASRSELSLKPACLQCKSGPVHTCTGWPTCVTWDSLLSGYMCIYRVFRAPGRSIAAAVCGSFMIHAPPPETMTT